MQLTVRDVAKLLNVCEKTVYRWLGDGILPAYRVKDQYRFNRAELLQWAVAHKVNVSAEIFAEPEGAASPPPTLSEALRAGGIFYRLDGKDKPSVLRAVVDILRLPEEGDRDYLYEVLLARESLGSTAIGDGIAIPHVRNPVVLHVSQPTVTLCFLETPIDFAALDGQPVDILFTLISPTVRSHLHMLSRLAFILRDPAVKSVLKREGSREEIMAEIRRAEATLATTAQSA